MMKALFLSMLALMIIIPASEQAGGTRLFFTATKDTITEGEKTKFSLACILQDLSAPQPRGYKDGHINFGKTTITYVDSFVIRTDPEEEEVARIVYNNAAVLGPWAKGATVAGNLTKGQDKNLKYLEVTWPQGTKDLARSYSCETTLIDNDGSKPKLYQYISVGYRKP